MTPSATTIQKAERLIAAGAVEILMLDIDGSFAIAAVTGDHGRYLTAVITDDLAATVNPAPGPFPHCSCTCEAGAAGEHLCSHETALTLLLDRQRRHIR